MEHEASNQFLLFHDDVQYKLDQKVDIVSKHRNVQKYNYIFLLMKHEASKLFLLFHDDVQYKLDQMVDILSKHGNL